MMPINTTISFVGYKIFSKDPALDLTPTVPFIIRSTHLTYYVAAVCVLLFTFVLRTSRRKDGVDAPFYKASKMKWMFDAETLVRDSYVKVGSHPFYTTSIAGGTGSGIPILMKTCQFYDRVYQIKATEGVQTLIPPKLLGELRTLPEEVLSATEAVSEVSCAIAVSNERKIDSSLVRPGYFTNMPWRL